MYICSFLINAMPGQMTRLLEDIGLIPGCTTFPAKDREALILVTEAENPEAERLLHRKLQGLDSVQCLALTYGHINNGHAAMHGVNE